MTHISVDRSTDESPHENTIWSKTPYAFCSLWICGGQIQWLEVQVCPCDHKHLFLQFAMLCWVWKQLFESSEHDRWSNEIRVWGPSTNVYKKKSLVRPPAHTTLPDDCQSALEDKQIIVWTLRKRTLITVRCHALAASSGMSLRAFESSPTISVTSNGFAKLMTRAETTPIAVQYDETRPATTSGSTWFSISPYCIMHVHRNGKRNTNGSEASCKCMHNLRAAMRKYV